MTEYGLKSYYLPRVLFPWDIEKFQYHGYWYIYVYHRSVTEWIVRQKMSKLNLRRIMREHRLNNRPI